MSDPRRAQPVSFIDLRSDTVTKPTAKMRQAMATAEVGDDVYGEDPTVNKLEQRAAEILGKEAALFVPSGTMGNTIGVKLHTKHGEEVITEARSHLMNYELSMMAWFCGCLARALPADNGMMTWPQIQQALRPKSPHNAPTTLIVLENTNNMHGGTAYPVDVIDEICNEAHARGLKVHIDGARIFNASVATGTPVSRIAQHADTVMFCLSKALGAPVGSLLAGPQAAIDEGRLYRKRLGGGMRQAGILAAAGLIALQESPDHLAQDHSNARYLAERLAEMPGIQIDPARFPTNILIFDIAGLHVSTTDFSQQLKSRGLLVNGVGGTHMRMVTHSGVTRDECERAAGIVAEVASATRAAIAAV